MFIFEHVVYCKRPVELPKAYLKMSNGEMEEGPKQKIQIIHKYNLYLPFQDNIIIYKPKIRVFDGNITLHLLHSIKQIF